MYRLKVGIPINNGNYDPQSGGSFSYTTQLIEAIDNYQFDEKIELVFINLTGKPIIGLKKKTLSFHPFKKRNLTDIIRKVSIEALKRLKIFNAFYRFLENIHSQKRNESIKREFHANEIKLLFYVTPEGNDYNFPFISVHWDIGHRSTYMFPEFHESLRAREEYYQNILSKALHILTETEAGKNELINYVRINPKRISVMPIFPGKVIFENVLPVDQESILEKFGISAQQFFIYPAQFWAHKNHTLLLDAAENLIKSFPNLKFVFTGSDKGNLPYLKKYIQNKRLENHVKILGFVAIEELYTLYKNAISLVMPSFLGPSNMPPLEAANLGCPVVLSNLDGHKELMGNYATYFEPTDSKELEVKLIEVINQKEPLHAFDKNRFTIEKAMESLELALLNSIPIRKTWD